MGREGKEREETEILVEARKAAGKDGSASESECGDDGRCFSGIKWATLHSNARVSCSRVDFAITSYGLIPWPCHPEWIIGFFWGGSIAAATHANVRPP